MKKIILLTMAIMLAGCQTAEEYRAREKALATPKMPPGCTVDYLGRLFDVRTVLVRCEGRRTTTTSTEYTSGKVTNHEAIVVIEE